MTTSKEDRMEKIITEFPNYKITNTGTVLSCYAPKTAIPTTTWRELQQVYDKSSGYLLVTLCHQGVKKNKRVHRLLMEAFVPNPENKEHVNHIDGNKLNNSLSNLEWATGTENARHAIKTGLCDERRKAQEVPIIQLDNDGNVLAEHVSIHEAGRGTGVAFQNISKVLRGLRPRAGGYVWEYKKGSETIPRGSRVPSDWELEAVTDHING